MRASEALSIAGALTGAPGLSKIGAILTAKRQNKRTHDLKQKQIDAYNRRTDHWHSAKSFNSDGTNGVNHYD